MSFSTPDSSSRTSALSRPTILIIDDEAKIRAAVCAAIGAEASRCLEAATGGDGLAIARAERPDLIVVDLGLPDMDGIEVCRSLRVWSNTPIVVLSARHSEDEKARLLDAGADDYMTKPFATVEFRARVRAQLRRARMAPAPGGDAPLVLGPLSIDLARHTVSRDGRTVHLTGTEWRLLHTLIARAGRTMTHRQLFHAVWGSAEGDVQQYVRVYIAHLRRKLEADAYTPKHILTEPGVGYRFEIEPVS